VYRAHRLGQRQLPAFRLGQKQQILTSLVIRIDLAGHRIQGLAIRCPHPLQQIQVAAMAVSGVRSSCDTSARNRRWVSKIVFQPLQGLVEGIHQPAHLIPAGPERESCGPDRPCV
jgi:hypothetical protein